MWTGDESDMKPSANGRARALPRLLDLAACPLSAYGMSIELPSGWSGRILVGAEGRPVLHAASFPLPSNDGDSGEMAKESMGREIYLNVRDLGPGGSGDALLVSFSTSDFGAPPGPPRQLSPQPLQARWRLHGHKPVFLDAEAGADRFLCRKNRFPDAPALVDALPATTP